MIKLLELLLWLPNSTKLYIYFPLDRNHLCAKVQRYFSPATPFCISHLSHSLFRINTFAEYPLASHALANSVPRSGLVLPLQLLKIPELGDGPDPAAAAAPVRRPLLHVLDELEDVVDVGLLLVQEVLQVLALGLQLFVLLGQRLVLPDELLAPLRQVLVPLHQVLVPLVARAARRRHHHRRRGHHDGRRGRRRLRSKPRVLLLGLLASVLCLLELRLQRRRLHLELLGLLVGLDHQLHVLPGHALLPPQQRVLLRLRPPDRRRQPPHP